MPRSLICTLLLAAACGSNAQSETKRNGDAVWSDDGLEIAYAAHRDVSDGTTTTYHWTLHARAADGTGDRVVLPERNYELIALFDMHHAGYFVFFEVDAANGYHTTLVRGSTVTAIGADVICPRTSDTPSVHLTPFYVPSPDGTLIARVLSPPDCAAFSTGEVSVGVQLLDSTTLTAASTTKVLYAGAAIDWTWTPDETFVFTDGISYWGFVGTSSGWTAHAKPGCLRPQTSSSDVAADGRRIVVNDDGTQTITAGGTAFGCQ